MDESLYLATWVNISPAGNTQVFLSHLTYNFTQMFKSLQEKVCLPIFESSHDSYLSIHYLQNQSACSPSRSCLHLHLLSFMGAPQIDVEWQTDLKWNTNRRAALFLKTNCGLCQCEWALVSCFMILRTRVRSRCSGPSGQSLGHALVARGRQEQFSWMQTKCRRPMSNVDVELK